MIVRSRHVLAATAALAILVASMPAAGALPADLPSFYVSASDSNGVTCVSAVGCVKHAAPVASSVGVSAQAAVVPDCTFGTHCQPSLLSQKVVGQVSGGAYVSRVGHGEQIGFVIGPKPCGPRCGPYVCVESTCVVVGLP